VGTLTRRSFLAALAAVAFATAACTTEQRGGGPTLGVDATFAAQPASSAHYAGAPQRVQIGILANDSEGRHFVTGGSVDLAFAFGGDDGDDGDETDAPTATARYIAVPGTEPAGDTPGITTGARGIYQAEGVVFDRPGIWNVTVTADVEGLAQELPATIEVFDESPIPAPGDRAPRTETLTMDSDVRLGAIDSMADASGEVPDPELHRTTIADAIRAGRPALVLFGTPAYCTSEMCGPEVLELQQLAAEFPDRAEFIHVEIWKQYEPPETQVINRGAADWLLWERPDGTPELTEPWLYLIGADGVIVDRWGSLFDAEEVASALQAL
jgi:hypothetical protein